MQWIQTLQERNALLFWFGLICLTGGLCCGIMTKFSATQVLSINAWIKPMKFFLSVGIFCWTMGWLLAELHQPKPVYAYSIMVILVMTFELLVITWQAANGRLSHFNISSKLYGLLFTLMGIAITVLTVWTLIIGLRFFSIQPGTLSAGYIWGIRLGIIIFVIFSFEGGLMASRLCHTVGAADGSPGLPVINWSKQYGDLRVAHFFGIHALQLLPLLGYYVTRNAKEMIITAVVYFLIISFLLVQALRGTPLLKG